MSAFDDARVAIDAAEAGAAAELSQAKAERAAVQAAFDQHMATEHPVEPDPDPDPDPEPSTGSDDLAVRVFPQYETKTYGNDEAVLDILGDLGVKRVSGLLTPDFDADEIAFYQQAHERHGIKVWFAVGKPGVAFSTSDWERVRFLLAGPLAGIAEIVSGWNEPNHRVASFAVPTAIHQNALWANVQQLNAATGQDIKVGTPPLWSGNVNEQYADLRELAPLIQGSYDTINFHLYPHGETGASLRALFERQLAEFTAAYGDLPMLNSESGYSTSVNSTQGNPVTEEEQAVRVVELVNLHRALGIKLSYFEGVDDPDPTFTNREAHFSFVRTPSLDPATWTRKPAFEVFRALVTA